MAFSNVKESSSKLKLSRSKLAASAAVMSALIAVLTVFSVKIGTLTVFNLGLLGVYVVAILYGVYIGSVSAALGSAVAEIYLMMVRGDPVLFLLGLLAARTPSAALIAALRRRLPVFGMVAGACLQTAVFLFIDVPLFGWGMGLTVIWSLPFNILLILPAYYIVKAVRRKLNVEYLA